jgi:hypothetical protein
MIGNTITVNYNGSPYTLNRVAGPSGYSGEFFYSGATLDLKLQIGHIVPSDKNGTGESHLVTLWYYEYDVDGNLLARNRAYTRMVSEASKQDTTDMGYLEASLRDFISTNGADILVRVS